MLQNTRQAKNGFSTPTLTASVPMPAHPVIGGQQESAAANGFYVGRIIDEQEHVGYSDPVYIP